ncbi:MAG: hypothetical protein L0Y74_02330 [candidate division Zixibacteria bacterium]|nr:hypothetical protein [candidate division Zixibacteria bacterium]
MTEPGIAEDNINLMRIKEGGDSQDRKMTVKGLELTFHRKHVIPLATKYGGGGIEFGSNPTASICESRAYFNPQIVG